MIEYKETEKKFMLGDVSIPSATVNIFEMPGYQFEQLKFLETIDEEADGGIYRLPPHTATRVVKIIGRVTCIEKPIRGEATFVTQRGSGAVEIKRLGEQSNEVSYTTDDSVVWINTGDSPAEILNLSIPAFGEGENMEVAIEPDSPELADEFWQLYHTLKDS